MNRPEIFRGVIHPWHHDVFGHMNVRWYGHFFDDAAFHLWPAMGISLQAMEHEYGVHTVTAKTTTNFIKELNAGDLIVIDAAVTRLGNKSISVELRMKHVDTGEVHATYEFTEVYFDPKTRRSAEMPQAVRDTLNVYLADGK